jgi:hypothetical protein
MAAVQGGVTNAMLKAVGREQGPDYMLKLLPGMSPIGGVITPDSSITELLNVVSYLCSTTRDAALIDTENSVTNNPAGSTIGAHNPVTGLYDASTNAIGVTFIASANAAPLFDINSLDSSANPRAVIPVGILRRINPAAANADPTYEVLVAAPTLANQNDITNVMSDCIKQMINILIKTRSILGPKGWTALFQQVKGGGGTGKTHAKRTHRRHRRRYSSKQY